VADGKASDQVAQPMRGLKAVIIGLAVILALCGIVITGTILFRFLNPAAPPVAAGFGISPLPVPPGCTIDYVMAEGDRLILQIGGNDTCRRVLVADLRTGALIGQFHFPNE